MDVRIDADDIDIAEAALGLRVRELDLVEADDLAVAFGDDDRLGVEVVCGDDRVDVGPGLRALLRMPVEGGVVDRQPAVLVAGGEGADLHALGRSSRRQVVWAEVRIGAHLIEHAVAAEPVLVRQAGRGRVVAVGPAPGLGLLGQDGREQPFAQTLSAVVGVDEEFGGVPLSLLRADAVADELARVIGSARASGVTCSARASRAFLSVASRRAARDAE